MFWAGYGPAWPELGMLYMERLNMGQTSNHSLVWKECKFSK